MRRLLALFAVSAVALAAVVAPTAGASQQAHKNAVATAVGAGQFKTLASLLAAAGLVKTLEGKGPFTVFAPTDAAFARVPKATLAKLAKDTMLLKSVLPYHVVAGKVPAGTVVTLNGTSVKTVDGASVRISVKGGKVYLNGSTLVTKPDVMASNGIIHVIDTVLLPPPTQNIVQTAVAAGQFKTLASLVKKAGLVKTLQGGSWTVFAPTDAAFAKVPKAILAKLGKSPALLKKVLLYHVVKGAVPASTVVTLNGKSVTTAAGLPIKITVAGGNVYLNGTTKVVKTDVMASNGVIHVINKVLLPPAN